MKEISTNEIEKETFLALKELCGTSLMRFASSELVWSNEVAKRQFKFNKEDFHITKRQMLFANYEDYMLLVALTNAYGHVHNHRCLMKRTDQSSFWASITSIQSSVGGQVFFEDLVIDISELVALEQQLSENKLLLAKVGEELDRFVYRASHDLRGPICTAKGLLSLMRHQNPMPDGELVDMMEANFNKLDMHVDKLAEVSKNNNIQLTVEPINLGELVSWLTHQFRFHTNFSKISFDIQIPKSYQVVTDKVRLRTILKHIIENCLDFCDVSKNRSFININAVEQSGSCVLEILDNGTGIPKHNLPDVFKMFYRASTASKGCGLGLFIAREAAIKLGGHIEIKSEFKVGTSLRISLPHLTKEIKSEYKP